MQQSMPSIVSEAEADPFLMCDEFGPTPSRKAYGNDTDDGFDVAWHPHHGMDILSYMVEGNGRHADSMGNRETFASPGFQWMSVGSGIEHAEGGGTPAGHNTHGFQIWLRMPKDKMKDDPRYGTVQPADIPTVPLADGGVVRVIAGPHGEVVGPAQFAVTVQILDVELKPNEEFAYSRPDGIDNVMFYGFKGAATLNGSDLIRAQQICRFDTQTGNAALLRAGGAGFRAMVFAGKQTKEKLVWHGPFVCASKQQLYVHVAGTCRTRTHPPLSPCTRVLCRLSLSLPHTICLRLLVAGVNRWAELQCNRKFATLQDGVLPTVPTRAVPSSPSPMGLQGCNQNPKGPSIAHKVTRE